MLLGKALFFPPLVTAEVFGAQCCYNKAPDTHSTQYLSKWSPNWSASLDISENKCWGLVPSKRKPQMQLTVLGDNECWKEDESLREYEEVVKRRDPTDLCPNSNYCCTLFDAYLVISDNPVTNGSTAPMGYTCCCAPSATIPCKTNEWSPWSVCSESCGGGSQVRNRLQTVPAAEGGPECILEETRDCNMQPCTTTSTTTPTPLETSPEAEPEAFPETEPEDTPEVESEDTPEVESKDPAHSSAAGFSLFGLSLGVSIALIGGTILAVVGIAVVVCKYASKTDSEMV